MQQATTFEHGGKVYEVRAIATLNGWKVRIFIEGIPANGFTYSVDSEVYQDAPIDGVPEDLVAGRPLPHLRILKEILCCHRSTHHTILS
jgi:hypothetical protein